MSFSLGAIHTTGNGVTGCVLMYGGVCTNYLVTPTSIYSTYSNRNIKVTLNGNRAVSIPYSTRAVLSNSTFKMLSLEASSRMGFGMPISSQQTSTPATDDSKYIIGSIGTDGYSFNKSPAVHTSLATAEAEAERLTKSVHGKKFVVVKLISQFEARSVVKTEL